MTKPLIKIHNVETDEIIEREMTAQEFAEYEKDQAEFAIIRQQHAETITQRQALLERLGLTEDEAKVLLG